MEKKRVLYYDIAKGIAILCIILGHQGIAWIDHIVFTFHVPIFFLITGCFINTKLSFKDYVKRKARILLVPYGVTCLAIICLGALKGGILSGWEGAVKSAAEWIYASLYGSGIPYSSPFFIKEIGAIWFLLASFWGSICLRWLLGVRRKEIRIAAVLFLFAAGYWSRSLFWFPFSIQAGCCAVLFMYFGFLLHNIKTERIELPEEVRICGIIFALLVWVSFIRDFQSFSLVCCNVGRGAADIFASLCGCVIILLFSRYIETKNCVLVKLLAFLGENSLFMLCIHIVELNMFPWWRMSQRLLSFGVPEAVQISIVIWMKLVLIVSGTVICSKWNLMRRVSGRE